MTAAQHFALATCIVVGLLAISGIFYMLATEQLREIYCRNNVAWEPVRDADFVARRIEAAEAEILAELDALNDPDAAELEWDSICRVVGLERSEAAARIRDRMRANADRRRCEEIERAEGWRSA